MPSPFELFAQRFGAQPLGNYNPFQAAPQYAPSYTPGAFPGLPGAPGGGQGGGVLNGGTTPPPAGVLNGGGNGQNPAGQPSPGSGGFAPGHQTGLDIIGTAAGLAIPGAGLVANGINAGMGIQAANQQADLMGRVIGKDITLGTGDYANAATGGLFGGGAYARGLGGYGEIGQGGITDAQNMADPGVMGAPRAMAASEVAAMNAELAGRPGVLGSDPNAGTKAAGPKTTGGGQNAGSKGGQKGGQSGRAGTSGQGASDRGSKGGRGGSSGGSSRGKRGE